MSIARIGKGITYIAFLNAIQFVVGILFYNILSRTLEPSEIGVYSTLTFILVILTTVAPLGLQFAVVKYVSTYLGNGDKDKAADVAYTCSRLVLYSSSALFIIFIVIVYILGQTWTSIRNIQILLVVTGAAGFFASIRTIHLAFIQALQLFDRYAIANLTAMAASRLFGIPLIVSGGGLLGAISGSLLGECTGLLVTFLLYRKRLPSSKSEFDKRVLIRFSLPILAMMIVAMMQDWSDRIIFLGISSNLEALGVFDLAIKAATSLGIIGAVLDVVVFPRFSESYGRSGRQALSGMMTRALRYLGLMYFPAAFGLASISRTAMTVLYQARLASEGNIPLMVLAIFSILGAFTTILNSGLKSIGKTSAFLNISVSALTADATIVILLSPYLGLYGAVVARAASTTVAFIYTLWLVRKNIPFQLDHMGLVKVLASSLFLVPPVLLIEYIVFLPNPFLKLGVEVLVAVASYVAGLFLFKTLGKEDLNIIRQILPARMSSTIDALEKLLV